MKLDRRRFLGSSVGVAAAAGVTAEWVWPKHTVSYRRPLSAVAVLNAAEYSERIEALLLDGLRLFRLQVLGRSILLKPNLVEDLPGSVNTNSTLIGAAARCFLRLGAARVVIGEGPGHQRDTELVGFAWGLRRCRRETVRVFREAGSVLVDLHRAGSDRRSALGSDGRSEVALLPKRLGCTGLRLPSSHLFHSDR